MVQAANLLAQDPHYIRYGIEEGLPSEEVYDIEQDNKGKIWICTDRGVASYDGYKFTSYDLKDGLPCNTIFEIFKDNDGKLWFSGYDGSICYIEEGRFVTPIKLNENLKKVFGNKWIKTMHQIDSSNYAITSSLRTTSESRLNYTFDTRSNNFQELPLNKDKSDTVGLTVFPKYKLIKDNRTNYTYFQSIIEDKNNYTYYLDKVSANTLKSKSGLLKQFQNGPSTIVDIKDGKEAFKIEVDAQVEAIMKTNDRLFVCSWDGLIIYDFSSTEVSEKTILKDHLITGIKLDREDNLWVSTQNNGVFFFPNLLRIKTYPIPINNGNPAELSVFRDHLFIGYSHGQYLQALDKELKTVFSTSDRSKIYYPYITTIDDIAYTSDLSKIEYDEEFKIGDNTYLENNSRLSISRLTAKLNDGRLLTGNSSLSILDNNSINLIIKNIPNCYAGYHCLNGKIILGTISGGMHIYNIDDTEKTNFAMKDIKAITSRINDIIPYNDSLLILASLGHGLIIYNCNSEKIVESISQGLVSSQINNCFLDSESNIWLGTNFGINILYTSDINGEISIDSIGKLTTSEGLFSNFILDIQEWNNEMWVICEGGVNHFSLDKITSTTKDPYIHLDSVLVSGASISMSNNIELEYQQNDLAFHYTGITFKKPKKEKVYRYCLIKDKAEKKYQYTDNTNLQFTNLDPGSYKFLVEARNNLDNWSKEPATFSFVVKKHFGQTLWFRILGFLIVCLIGYALYKYRESQLIAKSKQIQDLQESELRAKIAELDALRNQMNPHFIFNSLNSIQNFIFNNDPEKANYLLSRFSRLMRRSLEHSKLKNISVKEEIDFLSNYLELESMRFEEKFNYKIVVKEAKLNNYEIPPLLVQPLIENAVKHGIRSVDQKGEISVIFEEDNECILISVRDNGSGYFPKMKNPKEKGPNAIDIITERVSILNNFAKSEASFEIKTIKEDNNIVGTIALLRIPILQEKL